MTKIHELAARRRMPSQLLPVSVALLVGFLAGPSAAQVPGVRGGDLSPTPSAGSDARWAPWIGCWALQTSDNLTMPENAATLRACVTPGDHPAAVTVWTLAGDRVALKETIVADGVQHPVEESGCRGWRRAAWSQDGERLFTAAELVCPNEPIRKVSGLTLRARGPVWIDIQASDAVGRESVRIRRYQPAAVPAEIAPAVLPAPASGAAASTAPARAMSLEDVVEASRLASAKVVEAALTEGQTSVDIDSRALLALDRAGVPESVIDLMVALSYPQHFRVEASLGGADWSDRSGWISPLDPHGTFFNPWAAGYGSYSYFTPYYFTPFGYSYWWSRFDPVPVVPTTGVGDRTPEERGARAVDGLGYTRVRPRTESAAAGTARQRGDSGGGRRTGSAGASSGSSGGSSGGTVSTKGYSSGGSGSESGRTARPRDP